MAANTIRVTPLAHGESYSWANINVSIFGQIVDGITKVTYEEKQDKKNNYGRGSFAYSRGYGNIMGTSTITLTKEEVVALQRSAGGRLTDIPPFDIIVSYLPNDATKITTDIIRNAEFINNKIDVKQDDMFVEIDMELIITHVDYSINGI